MMSLNGRAPLRDVVEIEQEPLALPSNPCEIIGQAARAQAQRLALSFDLRARGSRVLVVLAAFLDTACGPSCMRASTRFRACASRCWSIGGRSGRKRRPAWPLVKRVERKAERIFLHDFAQDLARSTRPSLAQSGGVCDR